MLGKILIGIGILLMLAGPLMTVGGIYGSFQAMELKESAGIGAVGLGIFISMVGSLGLPVGALLALIGGIIMYFDSKKKQQN